MSESLNVSAVSTPMTVLVTGGSGFIAGHCILQLLAAGHTVRATLRSLAREASVRTALAEAGMQRDENLCFVEADLLKDDGWATAIKGCDVVLHVASPVQTGHVEHENDVIAPAREGTLRVLRAARDARVARVVLTSAFHAVAWGYRPTERVFTESDWSQLHSPGVTVYTKSKALAERAAWDFIQREGGPLELTTLLPVAVMGRALGKDVSGANHIIERCLSGAIPGYPDLYIPIVDVRDVARAHLLAMNAPDAAGQRFILSNDAAMPLWRIGMVLRQAFPAFANKIPTRTIPSAVVRVLSLFKKEFRGFVPDLGFARRMSHANATLRLGWSPEHDAVAAIREAADSLIRQRGTA